MSDTAEDFTNYPAKRGIGRRQADRQKVNWSAVSVIVAVALWLIGAASGLFGDYQKIGDRVTTLETQRQEDVRRSNSEREDSQRRMERVEDKIDRILERVK